MGLRTFLPTLRFLVRSVCNYINDHQEAIERFVGEEHVAKVSAANAACNILALTLDTIIPPPT